MTGIYQHCDEKHLHRYLTETSSATTIVSSLASATLTGPLRQCVELKASASCAGNLTEPVFRLAAGRFLRWRKKRRKK
jgi:hypothetical protein